jgi:hypothetical protein
MRILKSFPVRDEKTKLVSRVFDEIIVVLGYPWKFDKIELHVRDEDKTLIEGNRCIAVLDYGDMFIQQMDAKGIRIIITRALFKAIIQEANGRLPEMLEDLVVNREMIRKGFGDDLAYYYYQKNMASVLSNREKQVAWLSFYIDDKYNAEFFRSFDRSGATGNVQRLLNCLKKDLNNKGNLNDALRIYNGMGEKGGKNADNKIQVA